jgi:hypothetical protein
VNRSTWLTALGFATLAAAAVHAGPAANSDPAKLVAAPPGDWRVVLLATGAVQGWHEPCG